MDYPIRNITHTLERDAIDILSSHLPKEWIVREMTERDYGIDLYIEIVGKNRKVTGQLVAIQVKGKSQISFNKNNEYTFSGIKRSTINYWTNLPVPVFLIAVCVKTRTPYWTNINSQERKGRFNGNSKTTSVKLNKSFDLNKNGLKLFNLFYLREKRWPDVENAIERSLMSFSSFGPFCLICQRKNEAEICSSTMQYLLMEHYNNYYLLARYLNVSRPKTIDFWYKKHFKSLFSLPEIDSYRFSYGFIKEIISEFVDDYREAVRRANLMVIKDQKDYFSKRFPLLFIHLQERPLTFVHSDWFARYYHDEYEKDTHVIESKFFDDFEEYDDWDLIDNLNI